MARQVSTQNDKMLNAEETQSAIIGEVPPGTANMGSDITLEELGALSSFPDPTPIDNPDEGTGDAVVVLVDILSGVGGDAFGKGDVRRLSRIIPGYAKTQFHSVESDREIIKGRVKRLFDVGAIRLADKEEATQSNVPVTAESETPSMQAERNRRIGVEQENAILRQKLEDAHGAIDNATPGKAGASEEAQKEAAKNNISPTAVFEDE